MKREESHGHFLWKVKDIRALLLWFAKYVCHCGCSVGMSLSACLAIGLVRVSIFFFEFILV